MKLFIFGVINMSIILTFSKKWHSLSSLIWVSLNKFKTLSARTKMSWVFKGTSHQEVQDMIFYSCQSFIDLMSSAYSKTLISFSKHFPLVPTMNVLDPLVFLKKIKALGSGTKMWSMPHGKITKWCNFSFGVFRRGLLTERQALTLLNHGRKI